MTRVTVSTVVNNSGVIATSTCLRYNDGSRQELGRQIVDTRDAQIRSALIDLGWTPPATSLSQVRQADAAMIRAIAVHGDQRRNYTGEPYFHHLAEVAGMTASAGGSYAMVCAAWLHDTIEDRGYTRAAVAAEFGSEVADMVWLLSDTELGNRAARKAAQRQRLAEAPAAVQTIKCADLVSNADSIHLHDPKFWPTFADECRQLLAVMTAADQALRALALGVLE